MPYDGMPVGTEYDEVACAFNKGIITDFLRGKLGLTASCGRDRCTVDPIFKFGHGLRYR